MRCALRSFFYYFIVDYGDLQLHRRISSTSKRCCEPSPLPPLACTVFPFDKSEWWRHSCTSEMRAMTSVSYKIRNRILSYRICSRFTLHWSVLISRSTRDGSIWTPPPQRIAYTMRVYESLCIHEWNESFHITQLTPSLLLRTTS